MATARRIVMTAWVLAGGVGVWGCRDGTTPFQALDRVDESQALPRQLTFSAVDDRSPSWSASGDSVLYAAPGFAPFVDARGLLLSVPAVGGAATEVLPLIQFPGGPADWFASPVPTGDGRLAWMDLFGVRDQNLCPQTVVACIPEGSNDGVAPRLSELRLRVGRADQLPGPADPLLPIPVAGVVQLPPEGGGSRFRVENHPFQQIFQAEGSAVFRPSWNPSRDRVAFSDGLRILTWAPGQEDPIPVPGTGDGVQASWSPDGSWIAFTRLVRGPPQAFDCQHFTPLGPVCTQLRTDFAILARVVTIVRPDGSGAIELGPGDDPAWWPATGRLVFRRDGRIWSAEPDGSDARSIEGTEGGREPAVSPDGGVLAFARLDPTTMAHNIWLVSLAGAP